jgi:hypothetical protein
VLLMMSRLAYTFVARLFGLTIQGLGIYLQNFKVVSFADDIYICRKISVTINCFYTVHLVTLACGCTE